MDEEDAQTASALASLARDQEILDLERRIVEILRPLSLAARSRVVRCVAILAEREEPPCIET